MRALLAATLALALTSCGGTAAVGSAVVNGPPPAIRGEAGQIPLRTLDGRPTTLAAHGARVTVIALWAGYCRPCLDELPYIEALHRRYRGRADVAVIAVNLDDTRDPSARDEVRQLLSSHGAPEVPCLLDGMRVMEELTLRDEAGAAQMLLPLLVVVDPAFQSTAGSGFAAGRPAATTWPRSRPSSKRPCAATSPMTRRRQGSDYPRVTSDPGCRPARPDARRTRRSGSGSAG